MASYHRSLLPCRSAEGVVRHQIRAAWCEERASHASLLTALLGPSSLPSYGNTGTTTGGLDSHRRSTWLGTNVRLDQSGPSRTPLA